MLYNNIIEIIICHTLFILLRLILMLMLSCSLLSIGHKPGTNAPTLSTQFKQAETLNPAFIMLIFPVLHT